MKRFERSNGLDTALYKNYLYLFTFILTGVEKKKLSRRRRMRPCVATAGQFETICLASTVSLQTKSVMIETLEQRQLEVMMKV